MDRFHLDNKAVMFGHNMCTIVTNLRLVLCKTCSVSMQGGSTESKNDRICKDVYKYNVVVAQCDISQG